MSNKNEKTVKDIETFSKMLKNREKILKIIEKSSIMSKNAEKAVNLSTTGKKPSKISKNLQK